MRTAKSRPSLPIPTNGHPTRKAAIIELYEARVQQKLIAEQLSRSRNAVSSTIHDYRLKTGRIIEPEILHPVRPRSASLPNVRGSATGYRWLNYRKSTQGAKEALKAMGAYL